MAQELADAKAQLTSIEKDLRELCCCPLSFKLMQKPVLGTDLRTYEEDVIVRVLDQMQRSPYTRVPMEKGTLRPNILVRDLLETCRKHFPMWEDASMPHVERPPAVGSELVKAILNRRRDEALELLGRDVEPTILNGIFTRGAERMTLLQFSISCHLPEVAIAIYRRPDFRRGETYSSQGLLAIHMAAAFNYADLCCTIRGDIGTCRTARTLARAQLEDQHGQVLIIPHRSTAPECSRLFGHSPAWAE